MSNNRNNINESVNTPKLNKKNHFRPSKSHSTDDDEAFTGNLKVYEELEVGLIRTYLQSVPYC